MEDHDGSRWSMRCNHFDVAIRLPVRVSDVDHRDFARLSLNLGRCLRVHDRVERISPRNAVLIGATRELNSHK